MRAGLPVSTSSVFANDANYLLAVAYKQGGGGVMRIQLVWLLPGRKELGQNLILKKEKKKKIMLKVKK